MAKQNRNEIKVGIVVLVALAMTIYIVVVLGDWENLLTDKQEITIKLPHHVGLKGLAPGSPIMLGGAKIGKIVSTNIEPPTPCNQGEQPVCCVSFTMSLPADYPLHSDCVLAAQSNVLGGQSSLVISKLGVIGEPLKNGATIKLKSLKGGIADAMDSLAHELSDNNPDGLLNRLRYELDRDTQGTVLSNIVATTDHLRRVMAGLDEEFTLPERTLPIRAELHRILDDLNEITTMVKAQLDAGNDDTAVALVNAALKKINDFIDANAPPLTETVSSVRTVSANLESAIPGIISQIESALLGVNTAIQDVIVLAHDARETFAGNRSSIDRIIRNSTEVSVHLAMTMRDVRRSPWKLLRKPDGQEDKTQGIIDSAGNFVAAAERLDVLADRLKSILAQSDPTAPETERRINDIMAELEESFETFKTVEVKLLEALE